MADNSKMLLFGGAAAAAYWYFYLRTPSTAATAVTAATPVTGAAVTPVTPAPVNYFPIQGANTVSAIQARVILAAGAPKEGIPVDGWGFYLGQALEPLGKAAPDPMPLFEAASPGFDRSQNLTAGQYWAVMGPALKSQLGLSGLGMYRRVG